MHLLMKKIVRGLDLKLGLDSKTWEVVGATSQMKGD